MTLKLYSRSYCHLCEALARDLRERGVAFEVVDVDADPALEQLYGELIPVLVSQDGSEICRHFLDVAALEKALAG